MGHNAFSCSNHAPIETWFNVKLEVFANSSLVFIYLDNVLITNTHTMRYSHRASGGIIVGNGYNNIVQYKNLQVTLM